MSLHPIFQEIVDRFVPPRHITPNRWQREFNTAEQVAKYMRAYHAYPLMPEAPLNSPEMHGYFDAEKENDWRKDELSEGRDPDADNLSDFLDKDDE